MAVPHSKTFLPTEMMDAVRGFASLYVLLCHVRFMLLISIASASALGLQGWLLLEMGVVALVRYGGIAVVAFFMVSGYAIHYRQAFRIREGASPLVAWPTYARRRVQRLYPPLLLALALGFVLDSLGARIFPPFYVGGDTVVDNPGVFLPTWSGFLHTLFLVQGFLGSGFGTNNPLWSLSFEAVYYLTYPATLWLTRRLGPVPCLLASIAVGAAATVASVSYPDVRFLGVVGSWPVWVAGVFLADCRAGRVRLPNRLWLAGGVVGLLTSGGLAAWCIVTRQHPGGVVGLVWTVAVFGVLGALAVGQFSARASDRLQWLSGPFRFLAPMSYSLYVVHYPVLAIMSALWLSQHEQLPLTPWLALAGTGVSLAVAFGAYCLVERPYLPAARRMRVAARVPAGLRVPDAAGRVRAIVSRTLLARPSRRLPTAP